MDLRAVTQMRCQRGTRFFTATESQWLRHPRRDLSPRRVRRVRLPRRGQTGTLTTRLCRVFCDEGVASTRSHPLRLLALLPKRMTRSGNLLPLSCWCSLPLSLTLRNRQHEHDRQKRSPTTFKLSRRQCFGPLYPSGLSRRPRSVVRPLASTWRSGRAPLVRLGPKRWRSCSKMPLTNSFVPSTAPSQK